MSQKVRFDPALPRPNLTIPSTPGAVMGPQGVMLTIQTQINIPFRLMIGGFKPTMNNPQGDPRYPMVSDENLLKMAEEIMDEIKKRGLKF